jgi:hypothetical protein
MNWLCQNRKPGPWNGWCTDQACGGLLAEVIEGRLYLGGRLVLAVTLACPVCGRWSSWGKAGRVRKVVDNNMPCRVE